MRQKLLGIFYIVLAFLFVALMGVISKYVPSIDLGMLVFFQSFIALLVIAPWPLGSKPSDHSKRPWILLFFRAAVGLASQLLMLLAVRHMPLLGATLLANSAPIFIPLVAWAWLRQKPLRANWIGIAVGFIGIVLVLRPGLGLLHTPASWAAVGSALCSSAVLVAVEKLSKTESPKSILISYFLLSSLMAGPFAVMGWHMPSSLEWKALIAIGIAMGLAQLLIVLAYMKASASQLAPFNYSVVIFSGLLGWIIWNDGIDLYDCLGTLLVIGGGLWSMKSNTAHPSTRER